MNTEQKHTPEPWAVEDIGRFIWIGSEKPGKVDEVVCGIDNSEEYRDFARVTNRINAARIVACVNACAGMANPADEIDALRARVKEREWIDVADRLPEEAQELLFVRGGKVLHGAWIGGIFWHSNQQMAAAFWMPLPKSPTAGSEG